MAPAPPPIDGIREYLTRVTLCHRSMPTDYWYSSIEHFVLARGEEFIPCDPATLSIQPMPANQCFQNAYHLAFASNDLTYCEGWGDPGRDGLFLHAWCVNERGEVVDPTWHRDGGYEPAGYLGVRFPLSLVEASITANDYYGVFCAWPTQYEILRRPYDAKELEHRLWKMTR